MEGETFFQKSFPIPHQKFMENLKDILENLAKEAGWGKKWDRTKIWRSWTEILPEAIAKITKPINVSQNDVLFVGVENNYIMQELNFKKKLMLERVNSILQPENHIKDIKFVLDVPTDSHKTESILDDSCKDELDPRILERIKDLADEDLRETFLSFYMTSKKRQNSKS